MLDSLAGVRIPGQYSIRHNFEGGHVGTQTHANRQFGGRQFAQTGLGTPGDAVTQDIRKYDYIDALRGYAILAVLLVHSTQQVAPINLAFQRLASHGGRGVQLFYIASALTLCLSWQFRASLEAFPVRNFFIRRFFRIAPMFYVAMAFYLCLYGFSPRYWAPNGLEWWYLPLTALFLNGYHPETLTSVVPGGWSVAVEMNFYLLLPFLLLRLKTMKSLLAFLLLSLLLNVMAESASLRWLLPLYPPDQQHLVYEFSYLNFLGQLPVFASGLLACHVLSHVGNLKRFVVLGWLAWGLMAALSVLAPAGSKPMGNYIFVGFGFALFALTLSIYPVKFLVNKPLVQIGRISFSMYLTHFAVLELFARSGISSIFPPGDGSSLLHYFLVVAVTGVLSYGFYAGIERRGIRFGKQIIDRLEPVSPKSMPPAARI